MDSNILDPTLTLGILYYDDRKALLCLTADSTHKPTQETTPGGTVMSFSIAIEMFFFYYDD